MAFISLFLCAQNNMPGVVFVFQLFNFCVHNSVRMAVCKSFIKPVSEKKTETENTKIQTIIHTYTCIHKHTYMQTNTHIPKVILKALNKKPTLVNDG